MNLNLDVLTCSVFFFPNVVKWLLFLSRYEMNAIYNATGVMEALVNEIFINNFFHVCLLFYDT